MGLTELVLVNPRFFRMTTRPLEHRERKMCWQRRASSTISMRLLLTASVSRGQARGRGRSTGPCLRRENARRALWPLPKAGPVAVVFGPEKSGLTNEDLDRCQILLTIPTNPEFSSLNIAMAVQVMTYEIRLASVEALDTEGTDKTPAATSEEMEHFYRHLESVMTESGFLDPDNPRLLMRRLRRLFIRAAPDKSEVNILRGLLSAVDPGRAGRRGS